MKREAQLNKEDSCNITSLTSSYVPRTMRNEVRSGPSATANPKDFVKLLNEKLEKVKQEKETSEKVQQSLCKLSHVSVFFIFCSEGILGFKKNHSCF